MVNLAVINKKELIKYLIKFIIVIMILFFIFNFLNKGNKEKNISWESIGDINLTFLLDELLPGLKQKNFDIEENLKDKNPLEVGLKLELGMIDKLSLKKTENNTEEIDELDGISSSINTENNYEVEQAKTRFKYTSNTN